MHMARTTTANFLETIDIGYLEFTILEAHVADAVRELNCKDSKSQVFYKY